MEIKMSCEETVVKEYEISFTTEDVEEFKQFLGSSDIHTPMLKNGVLTTVEKKVKDLTFDDIVSAFKNNNVQWSDQRRIVRFNILIKEFLQLKFYKLEPHDSSNVIKQETHYWVED